MLSNECVSNDCLNAKSVSFEDKCCVLVKDKASINFYALYRYCPLLHKCRFLLTATH